MLGIEPRMQYLEDKVLHLIMTIGVLAVQSMLGKGAPVKHWNVAN
jgi:hypothetical protein